MPIVQVLLTAVSLGFYPLLGALHLLALLSPVLGFLTVLPNATFSNVPHILMQNSSTFFPFFFQVMTWWLTQGECWGRSLAAQVQEDKGGEPQAFCGALVAESTSSDTSHATMIISQDTHTGVAGFY